VQFALDNNCNVHESNTSPASRPVLPPAPPALNFSLDRWIDGNDRRNQRNPNQRANLLSQIREIGDRVTSANQSQPRNTRANLMAQIREVGAQSAEGQNSAPNNARENLMAQIRMGRPQHLPAPPRNLAPPQPPARRPLIRSGRDAMLAAIREQRARQPQQPQQPRQPPRPRQMTLQEQLRMRLSRNRNAPPQRPSQPPARTNSIIAQPQRPPVQAPMIFLDVDKILPHIHNLEEVSDLVKILEVANAVMKKRLAALEESRTDLCIMCLSHKKNIAFPCGHVCCCTHCSKKLRKKQCPICRKAYRSHELRTVFL